MNRHTAIALAFFALVIVGLISYQRITAPVPPEGVLFEGSTARVKAHAAYNMWGEDGNGGGRRDYQLTEPVDPAVDGWLKDNGYQRAGFEPYAEVGVADSLGLYPLVVGYVLYNKQE